MDAQQLTETYQEAIIQVSANGRAGTGFYLKEFDLIVTNEHVIGENGEVAIEGKSFEKVFSKVWFIDNKLDLAFLEAPASNQLPEIKLGAYEEMKDGDEVIVIAHPYAATYSEKRAVISKVDRVKDGLRYIQVNMAILPANSGGPVVNSKGEVIGITTDKVAGGDGIGFALPVSYLREALRAYQPVKGQVAARCSSCGHLVTSANLVRGKNCPSCGAEVKIPDINKKQSELTGAAKTIEEILEELGKDVKLAREGTNKWSVKEGSARILIRYNPDNFFIIGDAYLCQMPSDGMAIKKLYLFLLQENYTIEGLVLSCVKQNIVLSCLIYDLDITRENGIKAFRNLFKKADYYDDFLKAEYGCIERLEE